MEETPYTKEHVEEATENVRKIEVDHAAKDLRERENKEPADEVQANKEEPMEQGE